MRYLRSYQFPFESDNWAVNLLCLSACQLIPVIGNILVLGYTYEVIEGLHAGGTRRAPDFDFNRFGKYLLRGLWPFVVQLVISLPVIFVAVVVYLAAFTLLIMPAQDRDSEALAFVVLLLAYLLILVLGFVTSLVAMPMALRAGLSQEFALGDCWDFARDFLRRVGRELLLAQLFLTVTTPLVALVGLLLCFIGVYPAIAVICLAGAHLYYQLYELYLERGGVEIPLPVEAADSVLPG
jgi:hypothetical protein